MTRRTAWILGAALVCATPTSAATTNCEAQGLPRRSDAVATAGLPRRSDAVAKADQKPDQARPAAPSQPARPAGEHRVPWWKAPETRAELGISDKQSKDIDDIFQETLPDLRAAKEELDKLDEAVTKLIKEGVADVAVIARQVAQAEQARANLTTKRTVMLYRMHRLLTPEQRVKLDAMFERREAERRKNNDPGRR